MGTAHIRFCQAQVLWATSCRSAATLLALAYLYKASTVIKSLTDEGDTHLSVESQLIHSEMRPTTHEVQSVLGRIMSLRVNGVSRSNAGDTRRLYLQIRRLSCFSGRLLSEPWMGERHHNKFQILRAELSERCRQIPHAGKITTQTHTVGAVHLSHIANGLHVGDPRRKRKRGTVEWCQVFASFEAVHATP
jgi:hypothetical protein